MPGTWVFLNDGDNLQITTTYLTFTTSNTYTIKRLSSSEMFLEKQDGNDLYRLEFEKL
jgi:hypothetical protein